MTHSINSSYQHNAQEDDRKLTADDCVVCDLNSIVNITEHLELFCVHIYLPRVEQHSENRNVLLDLFVQTWNMKVNITAMEALNFS
jgi:hypothetical protein